MLVIAVLLLTACGRPLVINKRTPSAISNRTTTASAAASVSAATASPPVQTEVLATAEAPSEDVPTATSVATAAPTDISTATTALVPSIPSNPTAQTPEVVQPTTPQVVIIPATQVALSNNERWRQQETNRQPLPQPQTYVTTGTTLYWYDPVNQQALEIGTFSGTFEVLATFELRSTGQPALEVLYEVNKRYGLTAVSPAIVERIRAAGYTDGVIDTYVIVDTTISPR